METEINTWGLAIAAAASLVLLLSAMAQNQIAWAGLSEDYDHSFVPGYEEYLQGHDWRDITNLHTPCDSRDYICASCQTRKRIWKYYHVKKEDE